MKKLFVSMGLVAVGTASLQAAYAPDLGGPGSKAWNVSATLRGFYDDNYNTASSGANKQGSFGAELSPQISVAMPLQQTELGLRYVYGLYYYQRRQDLGQNPFDQSHQLDLWVDHAFTERWKARVQDSFAMGQEPELLQGGGTLERASGDNIANTATLTVDTDWTRRFSTELGYQNKFYHYQNHGDGNPLDEAADPSLSGILDRIENAAWLDLQWHVSPETMAFVGYRFQQVNYIGDEGIALSPFAPGGYYVSKTRDNRSHYAYVGVQHNFLANLSVMAKGGAQYTDNYNDPSQTTSISPYADISLNYTYNPGSYAQIGFTHQQNSTDVVSVDSTGHITQYQESSVLYASINHQFTRKLLTTLIGQFQSSTFKGGASNNQSDDFYTVGLNLSYNWTRHISSEVGYNFDYLDSGIAGRDYTRNRVYLGVTASY